MNSYFKISTKITGVALVIFITCAFIQRAEWKSPAEADKKKNPIASNEQNISAGKTIFNKECQSCHGKKGKGDGPAAGILEVPPGDLSSADTQGHKDGGLFWKISEGRKPMPSLKNKLSEDQIWQLVIYLRTFKK